MFAAAVVLWEALVGQRLFAAESEGNVLHRIMDGVVEPPGKHAGAIPAALDAVVMRALAKEPADRFDSALAMAEALEAAMPVAAPRAVGSWMKQLAAGRLVERAQLLASVESSSAVAPKEASVRFEPPPTIPDEAERAAHTSVSVASDREWIPPPRRGSWAWMAIGGVALGGGIATAAVLGREPPPAPSASAPVFVAEPPPPFLAAEPTACAAPPVPPLSAERRAFGHRAPAHPTSAGETPSRSPGSCAGTGGVWPLRPGLIAACGAPGPHGRRRPVAFVSSISRTAAARSRATGNAHALARIRHAGADEELRLVAVALELLDVRRVHEPVAVDAHERAREGRLDRREREVDVERAVQRVRRTSAGPPPRTPRSPAARGTRGSACGAPRCAAGRSRPAAWRPRRCCSRRRHCTTRSSLKGFSK